MARGIKIDFVANVRDLLRGNKDVTGSLDDVADALDDVADDAKKTGRETEKALDGVGDEAKAQADKIESKFSEAWKEVSKDAKRAGDDIGSSTRGGTDKAVDSVAEFKDEAIQNLSEVTSSFSGDMDSAVDVVQGTLGGLVSALGPAGMIGGALGAAGIGMAKAMFENAAEEAEALKQQVIEVAAELRETGNVDSLDFAGKLEQAASEIKNSKSWWEFWQDEPKTALQEWGDAADAAGIDFADFAQGMAGDSKAAARAQSQLSDALEDNKRRLAGAMDASANFEEGAADLVRELMAERTTLDDTSASLAEHSGVIGRAVHENELLAEAQRGLSEAATEAAEAESAYAEAVSGYLASAGEDWETYAANGIVNLADYNANIEAHATAVEGFEANLAAASGRLSAEAINYIKNLGPDSAPLLKAFINAPLEEQSRAATNWDLLGRASTDGYQSGVADLKGKTTTAIGDAQRAADNAPVEFGYRFDADGLQAQVDRAARSLRPPTVTIQLRPGVPQQ